MNNNLLVLGGLVVFLTLVAMIAALALTRIKSVLPKYVTDVLKTLHQDRKRAK